VLVHAEASYTTTLPLTALLDDNALIAHRYVGRSLDGDHVGPARLLVPSC
jgi:DMSO/TMAO reductase YedYZ molybdopterin-dependent catalytic subunit